MTDAQKAELVRIAIDASKNAHAPYSKYRVGAGVLTASGRTFAGSNVEVSSYSLTCCAERIAAFTAVAAGHKDIVACSVCTEEAEPIAPCGACRQVLYDFGGGDLVVLMVNASGTVREQRLGELLPGAFSPDRLLGR